MNVEKSRNNSRDDIWREPKYRDNGCLVAKIRNDKVKRLESNLVHCKRNGNGLPLTCNDEGEEIVYSRSERTWRKHLQSSVCR